MLDDYHNVDSPEIDTILAFLLDHLPTTTTLVVVTRTDPEFSQARQRARGQMTEITIRDLRFTSSETENFFDINFGLHLDSEVLSYLKRITEGWVAGLQLLAMNLHADTALKDILHSLKQNRVLHPGLSDPGSPGGTAGGDPIDPLLCLGARKDQSEIGRKQCC